MLITALFLMLATEPARPTWVPDGANAESIEEFYSWTRGLPDDSKPMTAATANCYLAAYTERMTQLILTLDGLPRAARALTLKRYRESHQYLEDHCGGPGGGDALRGRRAAAMLDLPMSHTTHRAEVGPLPFQLPPLPDRAGEDLGPKIWAMFQTMESRLASGGIHLEGEGRSCAWASGALAAAEATVRADLATPGIASAVPALQTQVGAHCRGEALAQKDAAWAWLHDHRATQPLEVAARPTAPAWPTPTASDGAAWLATALLILAPEAWPVLVGP